MLELQDKVAVVLGASAEGGTGWAIAEALAAQGAKVVVGARTFSDLKVLAERIGGIAVECDASDEQSVAKLAQAAAEKYGNLDIAVNSAGLPVMSKIADVTTKDLESALRVNYFGNVYFVKHMAKAIGENGSIVLISSMSSTHPLPPHLPYACAKAATDCLVRYAALEYGAKRIRVNSILPGAIVSTMARERSPAMASALVREVPIRRLGYPADFADAVLWLAGPAYVTGLNIQVNGGNHLTRFPFPDEVAGLIGG